MDMREKKDIANKKIYLQYAKSVMKYKVRA